MTADPSLKTNAMAKKMINASICAYQIHEKSWVPGDGHFPKVIRKEEGPDDAYFYNVTPTYQDAAGFIDTAENGYTPLFTAGGKDEINAALVGAMADGNLVLAIRGTIPPTISNDNIVAWVEDWIQDSDISPSAWPIQHNGKQMATHVETGFANAMNNLWPAIEKMIDKTLHDHGCTGVVITGHSKGAAMTFLAATLILQKYPQFKNKIAVHAFAAPVAGDQSFQTAYCDMQLETSTHRYQVENDLVPFLPLWVNAIFYMDVKFPKKDENYAWDALFAMVLLKTGGGYYAVGDFTYFDSAHNCVPNAKVQTSAMISVTTSLNAGNYLTVADAHSAVKSYLPCFK